MTLPTPHDPVPHLPKHEMAATGAAAELDRYGRPLTGWRLQLYTIIFEADTRAGKLFDAVLIWTILLSIGVVVLDSVASISRRWGDWFGVAEWTFTLLFTVEYGARLLCVRYPWRYARSFYGVIDLLAILPTFLAVLIPGMHLLVDVRILRLLRVFRIFKLSHYAAEVRHLTQSVAASGRKIAVFLGFVLMVVLVLGTLMYVVEGPENGYTSIPTAVYWAITTMTTVGFGDITPKTDLGRLIASLMMLLGWGVLAVPTGIVTAEMSAQRNRPTSTPTCHECLTEDHLTDATFCRHCGARLPAYLRD
jgi:voltage-gated potassium channel